MSQRFPVAAFSCNKERRRDLRLWRRAYKYGGATTSWSRTASRQDKAGAHFPFGKHAAPMSAAPFPELLLRIRSGALIIQRAWQWDARGRKLRSPQQSKTGTGKNLFPFLVEATGFAPLAARPSEQRTALFSLRSVLQFPSFSRKPLAHARASTLKSRRLPVHNQKNRREISLRFFGRGDGI